MVGEEIMFILLAGAFMLGVFLGVLIICLLTIGRGSRRPKILPGLIEN